MAPRAFLLCGDEKAVQAVTQILDELEVSFEHSSEPAFSLKRLGTQRFDLLIVDCDNLQNATQVFNSARASNLNKTSIAIAIVEGKAGVPSAFRLGASLVLTKPVSLEQTRNTLRTGIGMTRKEAQEAKAAVPGTPVAATPASPMHPAPPPIAPVPVASAPIAPVKVTPAPAMAAPVSTSPVPVPSAPVHAPSIAAVSPLLTPAVPTAPVPVQKEPAKPSSAPATAAEKTVIAPRPVSPAAQVAPPTKPVVSSIVETKSEPSVGAQAVAKAASAAATSSTPAPARNFDSLFATPILTEKPFAEKESHSKESYSKKTDEKLSSGDKPSAGPALKIVDPLAEEDALDPTAEENAPPFGESETFAGLEMSKPRRGKGALIAALVLVVLGGSGYGAWLIQPGFHKLVAWEYLQVMTKIAALRGQPQNMAPATPVTVPPAPMTAAPAAPPLNPAADPGATAATLNATAATDPTSMATNSNATPDASTGSLAASNPAVNAAPKSASVQPAKQDSTPNHNGTAPAIVPASASVPSNPASKMSGSDLPDVPEDFADDQVIHRVHPNYPKQARARKLKGTVVLQAIINKQGKVDSLQLVSGDALLAQAAADAVKQWRYKPYWHNGEPAEFQTHVTVDFKLPQ